MFCWMKLPDDLKIMDKDMRADQSVFIKYAAKYARISNYHKKWIGEKGYDPSYGARPLKRFLQKQVETQLARALVSGEVEEGSEVSFSVKDDQLVMKVTR